ncbi:MAG: hypothetical protein RMJ56_03420 [Gemmataceae bacterium]|nr:hypothetical protein [Gemmata sp.]MDW8196639.1 hypothetical protein [Gemmataceae bacterium]
MGLIFWRPLEALVVLAPVEAQRPRNDVVLYEHDFAQPSAANDFVFSDPAM